MRHRPAALALIGASILAGACAGRPDEGGWAYPDVQSVADRSTLPAATRSPELSPGDVAGSSPAPTASPSPAAMASPMAPASATVRIADFAFSPATVTVAPGGRVTWTNADGDRHSVLLDGTESARLETGATYARTFAVAGRFSYVCGLHPSMTGTVVVAASAGESTAPAGVPSASAPSPTAASSASPTADPTGGPNPTSSPEGDDRDREDEDRDDDDRSGSDGGDDEPDHDDDGDEDGEDHSGPGGGGSGHG